MLQTPLPNQLPKPSAVLPDPYVFVPITDNEAAKGRGAAKRIVRAHVTRVQHAKSSFLSSTQELQTWTVKPYIHRDAGPVRRKARATTQSKKRRVPELLNGDRDGDIEEVERREVCQPNQKTSLRCGC
jgi:hypothetical protein